MLASVGTQWHGKSYPVQVQRDFPEKAYNDVEPMNPELTATSFYQDPNFNSLHEIQPNITTSPASGLTPTQIEPRFDIEAQVHRDVFERDHSCATNDHKISSREAKAS